MFSMIKAALGQVEIEENRGKIKITAVRSRDVLAEIYNHWKTSRVESSMFTKISPYSIEFYSFFAVEFTYILDELMKKKGRSQISKKTMAQIKKGLLENTWLQSTIVDHPKFLNRNKLTLFALTPKKHQTDFFDHYEEIAPKFRLRGYTMGMSTGTGKTFTSLAVAEMLEPDLIITVCPKVSLYRVWEAAYKEDYKKVPDYWIYDRDKDLPSSPPKYLLYHFEALGELLKDSTRFSGKKVVLILDESHNLNELTSNRTQAVLDFCSRVKPESVFWASATPIKALGSEAIPMLSTFDPFMTKEVQEAFKKLYGKSSKKCHDIIRHRLGNVVFRVDVVKSNPIITDVPVTIKDPKRFMLTQLKEDMKKYIEERVKFWDSKRKEVDALYYGIIKRYEGSIRTREQKAELEQYRGFVRMISKTNDYAYVKDEMVFCNSFEKNRIEPMLHGEELRNFRSYKSVIKYLPLKVRGECLGNVVGKRREESTLALIEACDLPRYINEAEKKTIVFTSYVAAVDETMQYLAGKGYKPVAVYGGGKEDLTSQVKKFFDDKSINPLVATYQSLSTSVPLIAANVILAINAPFRDYIFEQAVGRIDRINQDAQTYVFKFYLSTTEPNISSRSLDILSWSAEQVNQILGVKEEAVSLEGLDIDIDIDNYLQMAA